MTPEELTALAAKARIRELQIQLHELRNAGDDYVIVSLGTRGPNIDMPEGNTCATVRMGDDEASAEAKYLDDAINLARAKILREREAREAKRKKDIARAALNGRN